IDGKVSSNGILEFMNPNGLIFGSGSVVSAAGVMAFGSATPWGNPTGPVSNAGGPDGHR
ncbi:filamentous hemeagglutinin family protein, partial [mine drainage metagenome]